MTYADLTSLYMRKQRNLTWPIPHDTDLHHIAISHKIIDHAIDYYNWLMIKTITAQLDLVDGELAKLVVDVVEEGEADGLTMDEADTTVVLRAREVVDDVRLVERVRGCSRRHGFHHGVAWSGSWSCCGNNKLRVVVTHSLERHLGVGNGSGRCARLYMT